MLPPLWCRQSHQYAGLVGQQRWQYRAMFCIGFLVDSGVWKVSFCNKYLAGVGGTIYGSVVVGVVKGSDMVWFMRKIPNSSFMFNVLIIWTFVFTEFAFNYLSSHCKSLNRGPLVELPHNLCIARSAWRHNALRGVVVSPDMEFLLNCVAIPLLPRINAAWHAYFKYRHQVFNP